MHNSKGEATGNGGTPLPMRLEEVAGIELRARYHAARVGGDFFDAVHVGTRVAFLLADIAGLKVEAHPIAAAAQEVFRRRAGEFYTAPDANLMDATALLIHAVNHALIEASSVHHGSGGAGGSHFAPTFMGCYDRELGLLAYVNAGGLTAVIRDSDGTRELGNVAMPMGLFTHLTYEPAMQAFELGARLLVVTKGVVQCRRGKEAFGVERVLKQVEGSGLGPAMELCEATVAAAAEFEQVSWFGRHRLGSKRRVADDLTALVVVRT